MKTPIYQLPPPPPPPPPPEDPLLKPEPPLRLEDEGLYDKLEPISELMVLVKSATLIEWSADAE